MYGCCHGSHLIAFWLLLSYLCAKEEETTTVTDFLRSCFPANVYKVSRCLKNGKANQFSMCLLGGHEATEKV